MTTAQLERSSVNKLINEWRDAGIIDPLELAEKLLDEAPRETLVHWLARQLRIDGPVATGRRKFFEPEVEEIIPENGTAIVYARMVLNLAKRPLAEQYGQVWYVNGVERETRELTAADVTHMIDNRKKAARYTFFQAEFLSAVLALMKKHKVQVLGELEEKGISLPSIERKI